MDYKLQSLENGLRVLTVPMPHLASATVCVWVKTGSRNEDKKVNGISHFLEHMVFKGSKKRPTAKAISEVVDSIGGEFNAATSKDWMNFYIKARNAHLATAFDVLSDMVLRPLLLEIEIEREKGTILQEIAMYEDTPVMKIGDVFEELAFEGNPLGWDTAGTKDSVKRIIKSDVLSYRKKYYDYPNMLISVAGGVTEKNVVELVKKNFQLPITLAEPDSAPQDNFQNKQENPKVKIKTKKSDQAHFIVGFMGDGRNYENRYAQGVLATILGGGMSSRLFIEVRERRGLAYAVKTGIERFQETGYMSTYAGTDPKKVDDAISVVLEEYYKIRDSNVEIQNSELTKAKEYLKGHLALALEDTSAVNSFFAEQALFLPEIMTPEEVFKKVDQVKLEDVYAEARRLFTPSRLNLAVIGPYKDENRFVKLLK